MMLRFLDTILVTAKNIQMVVLNEQRVMMGLCVRVELICKSAVTENLSIKPSMKPSMNPPTNTPTNPSMNPLMFAVRIPNVFHPDESTPCNAFRSVEISD